MLLAGSCSSLLRLLASVTVSKTRSDNLANVSVCWSGNSVNTRPQNSRNLANTLACVGPTADAAAAGARELASGTGPKMGDPGLELDVVAVAEDEGGGAGGGG